MLPWKTTISPTFAQVVLIISDQADIPLPWKSTFQAKGFTPIREDPDNALQACKIIDPALTVIDTHLPHAERVELCSKLRAMIASPILLLVPDYNSSQMLEIYSIGVDGCLLRPVSPVFFAVKALSWCLRRRWLDPDSNLSNVYNCSTNETELP